MPTPDELNRLRSRFLEAVYDATEGDSFKDTPEDQVVASLGMTRDAADPIAQYLVNEGLITWPTFGQIAVTHAGVKAVERARTKPSRTSDGRPSE
jgi:hypothetical protein